MRFDRAAAPFVLGALALAAVPVLVGRPWWALPFLLLAAFLLYFFRDPDRTSPAEGDVVLAPADGRVLVAGPAEPAAAPPGSSWHQVSIFLSPMDVHINRVPVSGRITRVEYRPGRFLPAYRPDAATANERNEIWIEHQGQTIVCRQVVGILARRIVCRVDEGAVVRAGERYGLMKFGSRIDLYLPPTAHVTVRVGDFVISGETVVARLAGADRE